MSTGNNNLGCSPGYEELGNWVIVVFTEVFPILLGFICNVTIFVLVRRRMNLKAYPQSVRKRRRRIMYYYMIACIWCWTPTILFYVIMLTGVSPTSPIVEGIEVCSRTSLYLTGFMNFLIFGMSDPHLSRSFSLVLYYLGLHSCIDPEYDGTLTTSTPSQLRDKDREEERRRRVHLRTKDVEKNVMFGGDISGKADRSSTKRDSLRYKLSVEQKEHLLAVRPDLDTRADMREPLLKKGRRRRSGHKSPAEDSSGFNGENVNNNNSDGPDSGSSSRSESEASMDGGNGTLHEQLRLLDQQQQQQQQQEQQDLIHEEQKMSRGESSPSSSTPPLSTVSIGDRDKDIETGFTSPATSTPTPSTTLNMNIDRYSNNSNGGSGGGSLDIVDMDQREDTHSVDDEDSDGSSVNSSSNMNDDDSSDDDDDDEDRELKSPIRRSATPAPTHNHDHDEEEGEKEEET